MPNEEMSKKEQHQKINAINFMQSQIAKYYGNDGILSSREKEELDELSISLGIDPEQYKRLIEIAKDEIRNFKKFDVVSYLLDREDKLKLYSDAERLSIRISRVERWISELKEIIKPKEDEVVNKREILIDKMNRIVKWFNQELFVETNEDVGGDENALKQREQVQTSDVSDEVIADEINDFMNDERNLAWRSYCKQALYQKIKDNSVDLDEKTKDVYDAIVEKTGDLLKFLKEKKGKRYESLCQIQYEDLDAIISYTKENGVISTIKSWFSKNDTEQNMPLKTKFESCVKEHAEDRPIGKTQKGEQKEKFDKIKIRIRQYSDIKKLFDKNGYKESRTEVDFQKHLAALIVYLLVVALCFFAIDRYFFKNLDMIHRIVESQKQFADDRDHEKYTTVEINGVQWMAENLNYAENIGENNGESKLPKDVGRFKESGLPKDGGRFYKWEDAVKACPSGWRLPTLSEWQNLIDYLGGESDAAIHLSSRTQWDDKWKLTDSVGFSALPAGYYNVRAKSLREQRSNASWWSYTMKNDSIAYVARIVASNSSIKSGINEEKLGLDYHSIRCVKMDGKKVPYLPNPNKADTSMVVKNMKGVVFDYKKGTDGIPIIRLSNGKQDSSYNLFDKVVLREDSMSSAYLSSEAAEKAKMIRRVIFPIDANVDMKRFYKRVMALQNDTTWKDSSLWYGDSVKVVGKYVIEDLDPQSDSLCRVGYNAVIKEDTVMANVDWRQPCDSLKKGEEYMVESYFWISEDRSCKSSCEENVFLIGRFIRVDIHAE